jgi:hypothetical protein
MKLSAVIIGAFGGTAAAAAVPAALPKMGLPRTGMILNKDTRTRVPEDIKDDLTYRIVYDTFTDLLEHPEFAAAYQDEVKRGGGNSTIASRSFEERSIEERNAACPAICSSAKSVAQLCGTMAVPHLMFACNAASIALTNPAGFAACVHICTAVSGIIGNAITDIIAPP